MDDEEELLFSTHELGMLNDDGVWIASQDHIAHLKRISNFLKRDDPQTQRLRLRLGQWETVRTRLLPLFLSYRDEELTVFACVKIFARLSMPLTEEMSDKVRGLEYLQAMKEDFLNRDALAVLVMWIAAPLAKTPGQRTDEDIGVLELFLTLFKNLLQIPNPSQRESALQQHLHDRAILAFHAEQVFDAITLLAEQMPLDKELSKRCDMLILELFYHLFRHETPDALFGRSGELASVTSTSNKSKSSRKSTESAEKVLLVAQLEAARKKVQEKNRQFTRKLPSRHSRFGTVMCLKSRLEPDRIEVLRNPFSQQGMLLSDRLPTRVGRKPLLDKPTRLFYNEEVRRVLHRAASQLVQRAFNNVFASAHSVLSTDINHRDEDACSLMELGAFVLGFQRLDCRRRAKVAVKRNKARASKKPAQSAAGSSSELAKQKREEKKAKGEIERVGVDPAPLEAALQKPVFRWVCDKINNYMDMKPAEFSKLPPFVRFYTELVHVVHEMALAPERETRSYAKSLVSFIFYDPSYMYLPCNLLKLYKPTKNTRGFLADLVVSSHYALRVLKDAAQRGVVSRKKARRKVKVKTKKSQGTVRKDEAEQDYEQEQPEKENDGGEVEKKVVGSNKRPTRNLLGSDSEAEDQDAAIQAAQPETEIRQIEHGNEERPAFLFGDSSREESVEETRIIERKQEQNSELTDIERKENPKSGELENMPRENQELQEASQEESEHEEVRYEEYYKEQRLDFAKYLHKFANPIIIKNYIYLLESYYHNPPELNAMLVRFLHRLAFDEELGLVCMFFQLSIFDLFDRILADPSIQKDEAFQDLRGLGKKVIRKFFDMTAENPMLFAEVLFWKPYLLAGDLLHPLPIRVSFDEEMGEMDVQTIRTERDRFGRILKRRSLDQGEGEDGDAADELLDFAPLPQHVEISISRRKWTDEEDRILSENWPIFKDSVDCLDILAQMLMRGRSATQVEARLKKLGLLASGSEGDRRKKPASGGRKSAGGLTGDANDDEWDAERRRVVGHPPDLGSMVKGVAQTVARILAVRGGTEGLAWLEQELMGCQHIRDGFLEDEAEDYALVPVGDDAFQRLQRGPLPALMKQLGLRAPCVERHWVFWRVPANQHSGHLEGTLAMLAQAREQATEALREDSLVAERAEEEDNKFRSEPKSETRANMRTVEVEVKSEEVEIEVDEEEPVAEQADAEHERKQGSSGEIAKLKAAVVTWCRSQPEVGSITIKHIKKALKKQFASDFLGSNKSLIKACAMNEISRLSAAAEQVHNKRDEEQQEQQQGEEVENQIEENREPAEEGAEEGLSQHRLRRRRERPPRSSDVSERTVLPLSTSADRQKTQTPEPALKKRRKFRRLVADSDEEEELEVQEQRPSVEEDSVSSKVPSKGMRKRLADDSDDGENDAETEGQDKSQETVHREDSPEARKTQSPPQPAKRQRRRLMDEDDEEQ
eukprot:gb/GEZN01000385.1/.p1 GENE.gb/GEZN01000385.1/~~gb/GEZN01000385.1/.p1  ORF type:complete len:1466 (+),score=284.03 gb/GEZN01000385.1/:46-4398(+)